MIIFGYSAATNGLLRSDINPEFPVDAKEISEERYCQILEETSAGLLLMPDLSGNPITKPAPMPPPSVPEQVTRYQARAALYHANLLDDVETVMADPQTDRLLVIAWQDAQIFKRESPMVLGLSSKLGLNESQLDDLFIAAAAID